MEITKKGQKFNVQLIAHRGANDKAPEHTMVSMDLCIENKLDYLEVDVRTSSDGILYNFHDSTLDRTTDHRGLFKKKSSKEIDQIDVGKKFSSQYAGSHIPRIETILKRAKNKIKLYFDVKDANLSELIKLIYTYDMQDHSFFWFKSHKMTKQFQLLAPKLKIKMNCFQLDKLEDIIVNYRPQIIECDFNTLSKEFVAVCHHHNVLVMLNFGIQEPETFWKSLDLGTDMIVLDYPISLIETIIKKGF